MPPEPPPQEPLALPATPGEGEANLPAKANQRWLPIPDWPGYEAGSRGKIRSVDRVLGDGRAAGGVVLAGQPDDDGYLYVTLSDGPRRRGAHVAVLVLEAFVGPRPSPDHEACHRNGKRWDNRAANLYWGTKWQNIADRERHRAERGTRGRAVLGVTGDEVRGSGFEIDEARGNPPEVVSGSPESRRSQP